MTPRFLWRMACMVCLGMALLLLGILISTPD